MKADPRESGTNAPPAGMRLALRAAGRGAGRVSPNPLVGASLERRDGSRVSSFHARFGGPHAEARLLEHACGDGALPPGSTLYVTLEPCTHQGKTPPCVERVLRARPARVVVATLDPDPRVRGRGVQRLREAGIAVEVGAGEAEALAANLGFHLCQRLGRAAMRLKLASSLDARLGLSSSRTSRITGDAAHVAVHRERANSDALLVGSGTTLADDPLLTVRHLRAPGPTRIVVDSRLRTPPRCRLWRAWSEEVASIAVSGRPQGNWWPAMRRGRDRWVRRARLVLATLNRHGDAALDRYRRLGWEVWAFPEKGRAGGQVNLRDLARRGAREGFLRILVEAGPGLAGALLEADLADEISLYLAPIVLGGEMVWPAGWSAGQMGQAARYEFVDERGLASDRWHLLRRRGLLERIRWSRTVA